MIACMHSEGTQHSSCTYEGIQHASCSNQGTHNFSCTNHSNQYTSYAYYSTQPMFYVPVDSQLSLVAYLDQSDTQRDVHTIHVSLVLIRIEGETITVSHLRNNCRLMIFIACELQLTCQVLISIVNMKKRTLSKQWQIPLSRWHL